MGPREGLPAASRRCSTPSTAWTSRSTIQYISWAGGFVHGDLGPSYKYADRNVNEIIADGLSTTLQLGFMAFTLALVVGLPLGIVAALGHNRWPDYIATESSRSSASPRPPSCWRSC